MAQCPPSYLSLPSEMAAENKDVQMRRRALERCQVSRPSQIDVFYKLCHVIGGSHRSLPNPVLPAIVAGVRQACAAPMAQWGCTNDTIRSIFVIIQTLALTGKFFSLEWKLLKILHLESKNTYASLALKYNPAQQVARYPPKYVFFSFLQKPY